MNLASQLVLEADNDGIDQLAVGAAIFYDGKLLIVTRAKDEEILPENREMPGGSVDPGENLIEAVLREMKEETSVEATMIEDYVGSFDFTLGDGRRVRQFNFLILPTSAVVKLNPVEHSDFFWFDPKYPDDLDTVKMTSEMKGSILEISHIILNRQVPS
jgi:8-oxo-dGTP diphosphatase